MRSSGIVLFICAGFLLSGGAILGGSVTWNLLRISYYFWLTDLAVELSGGVLMVAGALLCLPSCWLATLVLSHPKSQSLLTTLLCVTTAAMMVLSMGLMSTMSLVNALRDTSALNASLRDALTREAYSAVVCNSFAAMQCDLKCCGVESHLDWKPYRRALPPSCCHRRNGKHVEPCEVPVSSSGCLYPALADLRGYTTALAASSCALIIILAVTVFAAAYFMVTGAVDRQKAQQMRLAFVTPDSGSLLSPPPRPAFVPLP